VNNLPKVSVIIPVYNVAPYIRKCLDSLVNQTMSELEFICINDSSTDDSLEILNEYAAKDCRFVIITQENKGQGVARNNGIKIAKGEYIAFVDPDDWIELDAFEILYNEAKKTGVEVVHFDYYTFNDAKNKFKAYHCTKNFKKLSSKPVKDCGYYCWKDFSKQNRLSNINFVIWNKLYNREFILKNNIKFAPNKHAEDHIFSIASTILADKILYLKKCFYYYRVRIGSSVNKASDDNFCIFENLKILKQFLVEHNLFKDLEKDYKGYAISVLSWHFTCIPEHSIQKYLNQCRELLSAKEYKVFMKAIKGENLTFTQKLFSIKNKKKYGKKYKFITLLGFSFNISEPKDSEE